MAVGRNKATVWIGTKKSKVWAATDRDMDNVADTVEEFSPSVKHDRGGMLSMANRGPGTDGSQFFLTFVPTPHLDGKHTIYGKVTGGMETLKALEASGSRGGQTSEPLKIETVTIEVK